MTELSLQTNQQPSTTDEVIDLRQIIRTLQRRWLILLSAPLFTVLAALGYLRAAPRIYEAVSIIRAQPPAMPFVLPNLPVPIDLKSEQIDLKTVERLVTTRVTAQEALHILRGRNLKAVKRLINAHTNAKEPLRHVERKGADPVNRFSAFPQENALVEGVLKLIHTKTVDPDLVEIRVRHPDAELAALLANSIAEAMVHRFTTEAQREATQERRYIENSLRNLERQLQGLEAQIAQEKKRLSIVDIPKETEALLTALCTYELEWHNAQAERDAAEATLSRLQQQLDQEQPIVSVDVLKEDPLLKQIRDQLAQLEIERARLLATFTREHPDVQQVEERINALREALAKQARQLVKEREVALNPAYQILYQQMMTAEASRFAAESRVQALNRFLAKLRQRLNELPENQRRLAALLRKAQATEQVYTNLLLRLEEARIREATKMGSLTVADVASVPQAPVSPRPLLTLALSLVLGLFLGCGVALLVEGLNETVATGEEVQERLGIPLLASVPQTRSELTHARLLDLMASRRAAAEAVRTLRANLRFLSRQKPLRLLLVTSSVPGEGKTFIASGLAIAWAQAGHRAVLVDLDLRRPQVHECLQLPNEKGLSSLLTGKAELDEVLQPTALPNLQVITSGPIPRHPAELLDSERIVRVLNDLKERAEVIILDTPPILLVADTSLIVPLVDGVIVVVVPGETSRPMLRQLKEQVNIAQGHLLGAVLNKVTPLRGGYYYRYYRYYHRYYGEPE